MRDRIFSDARSGAFAGHAGPAGSPASHRPGLPAPKARNATAGGRAGPRKVAMVPGGRARAAAAASGLPFRRIPAGVTGAGPACRGA